MIGVSIDDGQVLTSQIPLCEFLVEDSPASYVMDSA